MAFPFFLVDSSCGIWIMSSAGRLEDGGMRLDYPGESFLKGMVGGESRSVIPKSMGHK